MHMDLSGRHWKSPGAARPVMTQQLLRRILEAIDARELSMLLEAAEHGLSMRDEKCFRLDVLKDTVISTGTKTLLLTIVQLSRRARESVVIEMTDARRELLRIKEEVACRLFTVEPSDKHKDGGGQGVDPESTAGAIRLIYRNFLGRSPVDEEIRIWKANFEAGCTFQKFVNLMSASPEAQDHSSFLAQAGDGQFIQILYEVFLGRGAAAREIEHWRQVLTSGKMGRSELIRQFFEQSFKHLTAECSEIQHDAYSFQILGSSEKITTADWKERAKLLESAPNGTEVEKPQPSCFHVRKGPRVLVTAIASLYKGGKYIEQFLANICEQSIFKDCCELIIVDADSPDNEAETIGRYAKEHKNIVYRRLNYRIGIYDAWNVGVEMSRGEYVTNTNLDDFRREDSFEMQASVLDSLPFVDVVYQDFYYTFDPNLSFAEIAKFGYKSSLPVITPYNLMEFNSPHNAPMWRKSLHAELGKFDVSYRSAGDYEFWMRCLSAGKVFYKVSDPIVVYYQNPEGLSTRPDTRGLDEAKRILKKYARKLISDNVLCEHSVFLERLGLGGTMGRENETGDRYESAQAALRKVAMQFKRGIGKHKLGDSCGC